jgi:transposase
MIVLGADTHKRSHTIAAVSVATGELLGEQTAQVGAKDFAALVVWARELGSERVWALEDCRHVSGSLERFLIEPGERVVRVTTRLMADARRRARGRGKSDSIDAIAVARAALREGLQALPAAQLAGPELDLRLLVDHRQRLVRQRVALNNTLQWHLTRPLARAQAAGQLAVLRHLGPACRPATRARRADDAGPRRP